MPKEFIVCIITVVLGAGGWFGSKSYQQFQARKAAHEQALAAAVAQQHAQADKAHLLPAAQGKKTEDVKAAPT